jgi:hypothetical protein
MTEEINQKDSEGRPREVWEWYYSKSKISVRGCYSHGARHGLWKWYDIDGTAQDKPVSLWETYWYGEVFSKKYHLSIK